MSLSPPTPLWRRARDEDLYDTPAIVAARQWVASDAWALVLLGEPGRGKSQAAAWLYIRMRDAAVAEAQAPGVFERARDVLWLRARNLGLMDWATKAAAETRCAAAYGLVVDEMGAEDDRQRDALSNLIEQRGDNLERTVITSNLDRRGFANRYGGRLASRLRAGGVDDDGRVRWVVEVEGEDLRGKGAA